MFIRRTQHTSNKNGLKYHTYKLVESYRTERGPRQRVLFDLGVNFNLAEEEWKAFADRVECIITGQASLFPISEDADKLAQKYARQIIRRHGQISPSAEKKATSKTDFQTVDIGSLESDQVRSKKDEATGNAIRVEGVMKEQDGASAGYYMIRSSIVGGSEREIFDIFNMLLNIEDAFRAMKSELGLRPVHHQIEFRCDGHLFITVLAYHVLNAIQTKLRDAGIFHNWATIRSRLASHYRLTTSMKRSDGKMLYIRKPSKPEECHKVIYDALGLSHQPGGICKTVI